MILSVPHTGTQFLGDLIGGHRAHVFHDDVVLEEYKATDTTHGGQIYSPLRDPKKVYESWVRRYSHYGSEIPVTHYPTTRTTSFEACWRRLEELDRRWDIFYVPIDVDREIHLQRLSERLGRDLTTDWEKVGSYKDTESYVEPKDLSWIYDLPMIKRFYG